MADRVRVAVVGAGGWGRQHARAFHDHPGAELVGIWSRDRDRADQRAAEWHTHGFTDVETMITEAGPDLISVCLPNTEHFAVTRDLITRGIPLLVEKPLVFDLADGQELIDAAAARDLFFAINFNHRYAEPVLRCRADLAAGRFGPLSLLTWRFGGEGSSAHHPHANLIETQCHGLDLLEHLGGPITAVSAAMTTDGAADRPEHRTLVVALTFASGAVGSLVGSYASSYAYPGTHLVEVDGRDGRALIENTVQRYTFSVSGDPLREVWEAGYFDDRARSFERTFDTHLDALLPALIAGDPPPVPAAAGLRALHLAHAIIGSFATGRRVDV